MSPDPEWLLSTTAQSAAAMVAIVGGFLVSRVVSLATDRQGVVRRMKELAAKERLVESDLEVLHRARHQYSVESFRRHMVDAYVKANGMLSPEEALGQYLPPGSVRAELVDVATELGHRVQQLLAAAHKIDSAGRRVTAAALRSAGHSITGMDEGIVEAIQRATGASGSDARQTPPLTSPRDERKPDRQERRIEREGELTAELQALKSQRSLLAGELARLSKPAEVWAGLAVLTYFAAVGVVVPLAALASRPVPDSRLFRRSIIALFLSGLVALIAYVFVAIRRLGRDEPEDALPSDLAATSTRTSR